MIIAVWVICVDLDFGLMVRDYSLWGFGLVNLVYRLCFGFWLVGLLAMLGWFDGVWRMLYLIRFGGF